MSSTIAERFRVLSCASKKRYPTQEAAKRARRHHERDTREYPCSYCDGWHLTSTPKRRR